jgi:hypothetical protein
VATDLRIVVPNRHGAALNCFEAIAAANVNLEGLWGDLRRGETWGYIHVLVEDADEARAAIERAGFEVDSEQRVEVIDVEDRPGAVAEALTPFRNDARNISVLYMANKTRLVVGTEDMLEGRYGVRMQDA